MTGLTGGAVAAAVEPRGSALASWTPLWLFIGVFVVLVVALAVRGRERGPLLGVAARLEARTGVPGWAATTLLFSVYGLVVAGYGFYTDVAWHVALGRDDELFTAPHTAILIGLCMIAFAPVAGAVTAVRVGGGTWTGRSRLPRSLLPLAVLGTAALIGFPIDELWHEAYGVDVTMWSPPHLIMILAASFSGLASWLVLADAGVRPGDGGWARGLHVVTAALTLQGLSSVQGEFSFGVPQWQQLFHPVLTCLAAGLALVLIRIVHGPGWALGIAAGLFVFQLADVFGGGGPIETRAGATYLGSAVGVEAVAALVGTERRLRFAVLSGLAIATLGLAAEWVWNQGAHQPWTAALLPEALVVGLVAALAAAVLGAALATALAAPSPSRVPAPLVVAAVLGVLVSLALPAPRRVGDVTASIRLNWVDDDRAIVDVRLDPSDAADDARWFTAGSWQWGDRTIRHMEEIGPGRYTSEEPLFLGGRGKALLRLHRGAEMMAVAIRLPADPEYDLREVPAQDRTTEFVGEQRYLQREADEADGWLARGVYALVAVLASAWVASLAFAVSRIGRDGRRQAAEGAAMGPRGASTVPGRHDVR
jgi:hypothetical protein